jgi:acetyl-CoA synthetase
VESVLVSHSAVSEAAVVGVPHEVKGQGLYAYVTVREGIEESEDLINELMEYVRNEIGPIARPEAIQFADSLPKTRSGKIMRRILRKIAEGTTDELGDTSTLADPTIIETLIAGRVEMDE